MNLSPEVQLLAIALALYFQDTVLLLYSNEGILSSRLAGEWSLKFGSDQTRFGGRELFVPNLLMIHRPIYRLSWNFEKPATEHQSAWNPRVEALKSLGAVAILVGVIQFLVLPIVIAFYLTDLSLALSLASLYLAIFFGLVLVGRRQKELGLSKRQLIGICFECVICPPLALNLVRKLSLNLCRDCDLVQVAQQNLQPSEWEMARANLISRLDVQMNLEEAGSPRYLALESRRKGLTLLETKRNVRN